MLGCEVDVIAQDRMHKCKYNETTKGRLSAEISNEVHDDSQWRDGGEIKCWSAMAVNVYWRCRCYGQQNPDSNNKQIVNEHHKHISEMREKTSVSSKKMHNVVLGPHEVSLPVRWKHQGKQIVT